MPAPEKPAHAQAAPPSASHQHQLTSAMRIWYPQVATSGLTDRAERFTEGLSLVNRWALWLAAGLLGLLGILTALLVLSNAIGVNTGNWWREFQWHLFGASFLLATAWCLRGNGHVRVDVCYHRLPMRARAIIDASGLLLGALPLCIIVMWYGFHQCADMWRTGEGSNQGGGISRYWPIYACLPVAGLLLGLQVISNVLISGAAAIAGQQRPDSTLASQAPNSVNTAAEQGSA